MILSVLMTVITDNDKSQPPGCLLKRMKSWLSDEQARIEKSITDHTDNFPELKADLDLLESIKDVKDQVEREMLAQRKDRTFQKRLADLGLFGELPRQIKYREVRCGVYPIC